MNLRIEHAGKSYSLSLDGDRYSVTAEDSKETIATGSATLVETGRGTYSVLFENGESVVVDVQPGPELEMLAGRSRFAMAVNDPRDRRAMARDAAAEGPREVRSQMPGKIIKVLVSEGHAVEAGDGLLVIEAMKMQNEAKSPKSGTVKRVPVVEGTTVAAGELLAIID